MKGAFPGGDPLELLSLDSARRWDIGPDGRVLGVVREHAKAPAVRMMTGWASLVSNKRQASLE